MMKEDKKMERRAIWNSKSVYAALGNVSEESAAT
jgi:hypothetical protein